MFRRDQRELPRARSVYASPIALAQFKYVPSLLPSTLLLFPSSPFSPFSISRSIDASSLSHVTERLISRALPPMNPQGQTMVAPR
jgi:hypothetical protein